MKEKIIIPFLGDSINDAAIVKWFKKEGDQVKIDDILLEIETEKVTLDIRTNYAGILEKILIQERNDVKIGDTVAIIDTNFVEQKPIISNQTSVKIQQSEKSTDVNKKPKILADSSIQSRSKNSTLLENQNFEVRKPMTELRKTIAQRLKDAQNTSAILTTFNEVDMSAVLTLRKKYKDEFTKEYNANLGIMSFFIKAASCALQKIPIINSSVEEDTIVYKYYYNIGIAVSIDQGLVAPILKNTERMSIAQIEQEIASLVTKARDGSLSINDMSGGTFTISNGGVYGSLMSTPIINPPQAAILGMHKISQRAVVNENAEIVVKPMMYLALSYDHRIIDGREAVTFLSIIKELVEKPEKIFLGLISK